MQCSTDGHGAKVAITVWMGFAVCNDCLAGMKRRVRGYGFPHKALGDSPALADLAFWRQGD